MQINLMKVTKKVLVKNNEIKRIIVFVLPKKSSMGPEKT